MADKDALVFAVDDEPDNLEVLKRALSGVCTLRTFGDVESAFKEAQAKPPALVLVDYRMPTHTGADFLRMLRAANIQCGAIFITAYPDALDVQKLVGDQEAFWVVPKPYKVDDLVAQVSMAVSLSRIRSRLKKQNPQS
jgi:response regulator RpfG family c-di-GMP phosphodiesterase